MFLSKLFGRKGNRGEAPVEAANVTGSDYKGFLIRSTPIKEKGQYRVAGSIEKMIDGVANRHSFVRADCSPNLDEITEMGLIKAQLMIDQQGEKLFG